MHLSSYFIVAFTITFICVCVFIIIFTFIFTFIFLGVFVFAFILYSYSYSYLHYHICIHVHIRIHSHTSVHMFVHDYIHICIQFTFTLICKFTLTFYAMPSSTSSTFSTFSSALVSKKEADGVWTCRRTLLKDERLSPKIERDVTNTNFASFRQLTLASGPESWSFYQRPDRKPLFPLIVLSEI